MIAVRVSPDLRPVIVGAPSYLKSHARPKSPRDLIRHRCINFRHGDGLYRWEFEKGKKSLSVAVSGPLIVDDLNLVIRAAIDGVGLAYMSEDNATPHLARGSLIRVLEDWCQPFPGFFLYYPSRRQQPAALAALIDASHLPACSASFSSSPLAPLRRAFRHEVRRCGFSASERRQA
jgi:DNA-binding transcriptional LysR family regulator